MIQSVTDYLTSKNIKYELSGKEAILKCPNCGKNKLSINVENQLYHCLRCEIMDADSLFAKGHFSKIQEYYGDILPIAPVVDRFQEVSTNVDYTNLVERYHYNLLNSKKGLKYLGERGFSLDTIKRFFLGFVRQYDQDWISIPSFEGGIPVLIKYRKCPPDERLDMEKYRREAGGKSVLFNGDALDNNEEVIILEGELDAISLIQQGYENVVGTTVGCGTLKPDWYDKLITKKKVFTVFDTDDVGQGQKAARDVWAARIGRDRVWNVLLPKGYDCNSFFLEHTKEDFDALLSKAEMFKVAGVLSMGEVLYKMYSSANAKGEESRFSTPWNNLNKLLDGGLKNSWLITIGGQPGVGKTSFVSQLGYHFVTQHDIPCLIFCMEMPDVSLGVKIIQLKYDLVTEEIRFSDAMVYSRELSELPLYFGYSSKITPQIYYNTVREAKNRYGIGIAMFDNLQYLVRSDKESDISNASRMFKDMSMEFNMINVLISQPRKINSERTMTFDDLKGSSSIPADSDMVILINRQRIGSGESTLAPIADILVDKTRWSSGGRCKMLFVGEKSRFEEEHKI